MSVALTSLDPPLKFEERLNLEESIENLESLALILNCLLEQIGERLLSRSLATDQLRLLLHLEVHEDRDVREQKQTTADSWVRPSIHQSLSRAPGFC